MDDRIQTRIFISPLFSNGGKAGKRIGFKGSNKGVFKAAAKGFCDTAKNAVNMLDFNINSRLSIGIFF